MREKDCVRKATKSAKAAYKLVEKHQFLSDDALA
jgi:hypothetical protein